MTTITWRQIISDVKGGDKIISQDASISDRVIYNELRTTSLYLLKQQTDKRRLYQSPNLFTPIPCLPMKRVPLAECCDYTSEVQVARSIAKIPRIAEGIFGSLIQEVSSVNNRKKFKECTPMRYANILRLGLTNTNNVYFWLYRDYLYVSQEDTEAVNLFAYFEEDIPNSLLYPGADCSCTEPPSNSDLCLCSYDKSFRFPGYLTDAVKKMVNENLLKTYFNLPAQKWSSGNDQQSKAYPSTP